LRREKDIEWVQGGSNPDQFVPPLNGATTQSQSQSQIPRDCKYRNFPVKNAAVTSISPKGISGCSSWLVRHKTAVELYGFLHQDGPSLLATNVENFWPALYSDPGHTISRLLVRAMKYPAQIAAALIGFDINRKQLTPFPNPGFFLRKHPLEPFILPTTNVCRWLAAKENDDIYIAKVAAQIDKETKNSGGCFAITTFFPGLSANDGDENREAAIKALRCVLKIAHGYNLLVKEERIKVVEAVGGWLTCNLEVLSEDESQPHANVWNTIPALKAFVSDERVRTLARKFGMDMGDQYVRARVITSEKAKGNIISALHEVIKADGNISLAIALDPGPLFAIQNWSDLDYMARELEKHPLLSRRVGFNCDIAHWRMAGITPDHIIADLHPADNPDSAPTDGHSPSVASRLIHTHVSDSGKGFLGYLPPEEKTCKEWLVAVKMAYGHASDQAPKPTGLMSIELELAASSSIIDKALRINRLVCESNVDD
jgi:hypothetical protein